MRSFRRFVWPFALAWISLVDACGPSSGAVQGSQGSDGGDKMSSDGGDKVSSGSGQTDAGGSGGADAGRTDAGGSRSDGGDAGAKPLYSVNDVTYVFPLPTKDTEFADLLGIDASGAQGALLSQPLFTELVQPNFPTPANLPHALRVVGLRLDPCAGETVVTDAGSCESEIRLVVQPITVASGIGADDSGVHLIYRVSRAELNAALTDLVSLRNASGVDTAGIPLGPHPAMVKEGLGGAFAQGVNTVILKYVGMSNLYKVTEFKLDALNIGFTVWNFFQYQNDGGSFSLTTIPTQPSGGGQEQVVENGSAFDTARSTSISNLDAAVGYPEALLNSSTVAGLDQSSIVTALNRLAAIEDPSRYSNLTVDCASCHLSSTGLLFYEQLAHDDPTELYQAPPGQDVAHVDDAGVSANMLHALSYSGYRLQVSQRAINESARIADWLSNAF